MAAPPDHQIKIGKGLGTLAEETLRFYRQIDVEHVGLPTRYHTRVGTRPLVPPTQTGPRGALGPAWDESELLRIRERIESFGLTPSEMGLPLSGNIVYGRPERDQDFGRLRDCIAMAGRLGVSVMTYSFTALRASEGYGALPGAGRGGSDLRDFDHERIGDLPPLDSVGCHSLEDMWERLTVFLRETVPAAEEAGVRLAAHPNDPPIPEYRGVAQPLSDLDGLERLLDTLDSPANSLFFDTGVTTELGEDAVQAIRRFGGRDRIAIVHFRNVRVEIPRYRYVETFHDEGDCDMFGCMQAFSDVGYTGLLDPDHTPGIIGDTPDTRIGWAFAIGQMVAMRDAVEQSS
jgi:mannonate dehydratase